MAGWLAPELTSPWAKVELLTAQIRQLEGERAEALRSDPAPAVELVRRLLQVRGIGVNSAWLYVMEFFGWRQFRNRREVGGFGGPDADALSEWSDDAGAGDRQGGQPVYPGHGDRDCVGLVAVSAGECAESVVPGALWAGE